jgi:hypothetical protein
MCPEPVEGALLQSAKRAARHSASPHAPLVTILTSDPVILLTVETGMM